MKTRWLALTLLSTLAQGSLHAAEELSAASSFAFPSVQEGAGARALSLGSTYVGIAEGSSSLFWNPAGLGALQALEVALHHTAGLVGATQEIAVFGLPLGHSNGLGVSLSYEDNGAFDAYDANGNAAGTFAAKAYGASIGWGVRCPSAVSFGLTLKGNRQDIAGTVANSVAGDIGLKWEPNPDLSLGAAYTNLGPAVDGQQLAQGLRVGGSAYAGKCTNMQLLFAVSGEALTHGDNSLHFGLEGTLHQFLALRAGYAFAVPAVDTAGIPGWTLGAGVIADKLSLDYAVVPKGDLGNMQRISLTYGFGEPCKSPSTL